MFHKLVTLCTLAAVLCEVLSTCPRYCRCLHGNQVECSSSQLIRVPVGLPDDTEKLFLDGNNIAVVYAEDFRLLTNLKFLTIANSHVSEIQDGSFDALSQLEELNLNMNSLRLIKPATLSGLSSLKIMRIDQNHALRMAPCTLSVIPTIESLNADLTRITFNASLFLNASIHHVTTPDLSAVPEEDFVSLDSLKYLRLERADASAINYRIMSLMPNIVSLNLQSTAIQSIEDRMFRKNRFLTTLVLTANLLRNIGNATFVGLKRLQILELSSNYGLQIHPNTFLATRKLKTLYLKQIGLQELSINFFSFQQLTNLIISGNELTYISPGTLSGVGSIRICLGHNPWHCDCNLLWLYEWLRQFSLGNLLGCVSPQCKTPAALAGDPLLALSRDAFQCINDTVTEGPDRETVTPFYRRILPWNSGLTPPNEDSAYTWVPYTYAPNQRSNPNLTNRSNPSSESTTPEGPEIETDDGGTTERTDRKDVQIPLKPIDNNNNNKNSTSSKPRDDDLLPYNRGRTDAVTEIPHRSWTFQKPSIRPATGFHEVGSVEPDDGITMIILCTEVGVACLIVLAILWILLAIRRANKNRQERLRWNENGLGMETVSPLRYFHQR